jgi:hypothetical protein
MDRAKMIDKQGFRGFSEENIGGVMKKTLFIIVAMILMVMAGCEKKERMYLDEGEGVYTAEYITNKTRNEAFDLVNQWMMENDEYLYNKTKSFIREEGIIITTSFVSVKVGKATPTFKYEMRVLCEDNKLTLGFSIDRMDSGYYPSKSIVEDISKHFRKVAASIDDNVTGKQKRLDSE